MTPRTPSTVAGRAWLDALRHLFSEIEATIGEFGEPIDDPLGMILAIEAEARAELDVDALAAALEKIWDDDTPALQDVFDGVWHQLRPAPSLAERVAAAYAAALAKPKSMGRRGSTAPTLWAKGEK